MSPEFKYKIFYWLNILSNLHYFRLFTVTDMLELCVLFLCKLFGRRKFPFCLQCLFALCPWRGCCEGRKLMPGWFVIAGWLRSGSAPLSVSQMAKPWRSHKQYLWTYQCNQGRGLNKGWPHHSSWWVCHHFSLIYVQIVHSAEWLLLGLHVPAWSRWGLVL